MSFGPGKYVDACTLALIATQAELALLVVIGGRLGEGFEVQTTDPSLMAKLPELLRTCADQIEKDMKARAAGMN